MFKLSIICIVTLGLLLQACGEPSRFETACVNFVPWASQMSKSKQKDLCSCMDDYRSELSESYQEKITIAFERDSYNLSVRGDKENNRKFFKIYYKCYR